MCSNGKRFLERKALGDGQVDFGENFVWGIDFRFEEYPDIMIYKWIIVDNHSKNRQLLQINLMLY